MKNKEAKPNAKPQKNPDGSYSFTTDNIKDWQNMELMPHELADSYLEMVSHMTKRSSEYKEFKKNNPDASYEEELKFFNIPRTLTQQECIVMNKEMQSMVDFHNFLIHNWELLSKSDLYNNAFKNEIGLFNNVNLDKNFGISTSIAYLMYHIEYLVQNAELIDTHNNTYALIGTCKNSYGETIKLTYEFEANSLCEAQIIYNQYKKMMLADGITVWMSYWRIANEQGRTSFCKCQFIEPMKRINEGKKSSFFSVARKKKQWEITKKIRRTFLSVEKTIEKGKSSKPVVRWIEQALLTIVGGEKEIDASNGYPTTIVFDVLPQGQHDGFFPAIYKNETLQSPPCRSLLEFIIQTRMAHLYYGAKAEKKNIREKMFLDWPSLYKNANLEGTAKSNHRVAKARIRKELDHMKMKNIISEYYEDEEGIHFKLDMDPYNKKQKTKNIQKITMNKE